ncbi:MAG: hypothetical protein JOZ39_12435 [Chloroflexi bacterium]|nr:hypothetical protein [Chloroflexota bacterium]
MFGRHTPLQLLETTMTFVCPNRPNETVVVTNPMLQVEVDNSVMEDWWGDAYAQADAIVYTQFGCLCGEQHRYVFCQI